MKSSLAYGCARVIEIATYHHTFGRELACALSTVDAPPPRTYSVSVTDAGSAVFGAAMFDMAITARTACQPAARRRVRLLAGLGMKYLNVLDDVLDDPRLASPAQERVSLLNAAVAMTWGGDVEVPSGSPRDRFDDAVALGRALRRLVERHGMADRYAAVIRSFAVAEAAHCQAVSPQELLELGQKVGSLCGDIIACAVGAVVPGASPAITLAAQGLGVFGGFLDHAYEVNADLREGSRTVVTELVKAHGDTRRARKAARSLCVAAAHEAYTRGLSGIAGQEQMIYRSLGRLFTFRYRVVSRVTDAFIRSPPGVWRL